MKQDWLIKIWSDHLEDFKRVTKQIKKILEKPLAYPIDYYFEQAGKSFFKAIDKIEFSFDIPKSYRKIPTGNGTDTRKYGCYREYWLCIISLFCRKDSQFMKYWNARDFGLPRNGRKIDWSYVNDDHLLAEQYFITEDDFDTLQDVCEASILLCENILELRKDQKLKFHPDGPQKRIVYYKNKTIRFGGDRTWERFKLLYDAKGDYVEDRILVPNKNQDPNVVVGELRRYFIEKHNAPEIASAITKKDSPGYYLNFNEL